MSSRKWTQQEAMSRQGTVWKVIGARPGLNKKAVKGQFMATARVGNFVVDFLTDGNRASKLVCHRNLSRTFIQRAIEKYV